MDEVGFSSGLGLVSGQRYIYFITVFMGRGRDVVFKNFVGR